MKRIAPWIAVVILIALGAATVIGSSFSKAMQMVIVG